MAIDPVLPQYFQQNFGHAKHEDVRALKRATIHGMTWYKGQMMTASQLRAKPLPLPVPGDGDADDCTRVWAALPTSQRLETVSYTHLTLPTKLEV